MANTQLTWANIIEFVSAVHSREGATPNPTVYRLLGNQALKRISRAMGGIRTQWDNTTGTGALTIVTNSVALPIDCMNATEVEWGGDLLEERTVEEMNYEAEGWRDDTGTAPTYWMRNGHNLLFDVAPTTTTSGILVVRGRGLLPDFSDTQGATNPLTYLSSDLQLSPAYYILANLPAVKKVVREGGQIIGIDDSELARKAEYSQMWELAFGEIRDGSRERQYQPFSY